MMRLSTLAIALLLLTTINAQTTDLVFFTDDGSKFTLIVDGDVKNNEPATRVVATGIRNESPVVMVKFEDPAIAQLKKPGYFPLGKEYTVMITTNKKGERVLRPTGEADLGTASKGGADKPKPPTFVDDAPATISTTDTETVDQTIDVGGVQQTTTVIVTEDGGTGTGENVNINMGVNGIGFNMNVKVDDAGMDMGTGTTTTTTRTTTTTTTSSSSAGATMVAPKPVVETPKPVSEPAVYRMPGYNGRIGCSWPMSATEFAEAKRSIESKGFEETKMTLAKQITRDHCFTVDQVKDIMSVFGFEDTRLEFAKLAYDNTYDLSNYYKVSDAFSFESSMEELNEYIQSR